jgi:ornithine cyclodeaminase/alanine dehydrogenase-like protein (mu-crystallin family)
VTVDEGDNAVFSYVSVLDMTAEDIPLRNPRFLTSKELVRLGTHINAVGSNLPNRRELNPRILLKSKIVVDSVEQSTKDRAILSILYRLGHTMRSKSMPSRGDSSVSLAVKDIARLAYSTAIKSNRGTEVSMEDKEHVCALRKTCR